MSRAEIQKRYREKKKQESGNYLKKERERKRKAYIPTALLSEHEAKKRRTETLKRVKSHYAKIKNEKEQIMNAETMTMATRQTGSPISTLKVKLNFKRKGRKCKCNSKLMETKRQIINLERKTLKLVKDKRRLQRKMQRSKQNDDGSRRSKTTNDKRSETETDDECSECITVTTEDESSTVEDSMYTENANETVIEHSESSTKNASDSQNMIIASTSLEETDHNLVQSTLTPNSKANNVLRESGLSPSKHRNIKRNLLEYHILEQEVKKSKLLKQSALKTAKKYRCLRSFSKKFGVSRSRLGKKKQRESFSQRKYVKNQVQKFFERENTCVTMPGKKDAKGKHQKRILTDYLHNLHDKFRLENPDSKISRSAFSKMRPKHVLLVNFCNRNTCLCSRHQNIALKLKAIQEIAGTKNPDDFIAHNTDNEIYEKLQKIDKSNVTYTEWKRQDENGKMRWKQVQTVFSKDRFVAMLTEDVKLFRKHVQRVKTQYGEMRRLRENLQDSHVLVWMDFAENFTCAALDEVQSAYWTSEQVTLHTTVVYFPKSHSKTHKSVVGVSDLNIHNASMVKAMICNLIPTIKAEYPALKYVHYLTDSPTSQYRNKSIFELLTRHDSLFGVGARWDYLESGHGKGPCDGLGGSVKRSADMAVKQGKAVIQNGKDFYRWAEKQTDAETSVSYYFVTQEMYNAAADDMKEKAASIKAVNGTFKIHAVVPVGENKVITREVSCNCNNCLNDVSQSTCEGWKVHELYKRPASSTMNVRPNSTPEKETPNQEVNKDTDTDNSDEEPIKLDVGEYCAALFESEWYIGVVTETNDTQGKTKINFMEEVGKKEVSFRWPNKRDETWILNPDILTKIPEPYPSGSRKRLFKLGKEILDLIEKLHEQKVKG